MNQQVRRFCVLAAVGILMGQAAYGLNNRSWVSNAGSGTACTLASPCASFLVAHDATAAGGQINVLNPGDYGRLTISKEITIDGGGALTSMLVISGTTGITINAGASDTVVRNLSIAAAPGATSTNGIEFTAGNHLVREQ